MPIALLLLALSCPDLRAGRTKSDDVSWRRTVELYQMVPCLTEDQLDFGREVIRGLSYNSQRAFRRVCLLPGIDFERSRRAWAELLRLRLSYEQTLSFERWTLLRGVDADLAIQALEKIKTLSYEAGRAFRAYLQLPGITPRHALQTISLLTSMDDANNRAVRAFFTIQDIDADLALDGLMVLALLKDKQGWACESFASIRNMNTETMLDALPLLRQLRQDDAWNAHKLFLQPDMDRISGWNWLVRYFANPPEIQEIQYYKLSREDKRALLQAFYDGGEEIIWKINNLHSITDRFGFEISSARLWRWSDRALRKQFEQLSREVVYEYGREFYPAFNADKKGAMITALRRATAAERRATARNLTSPDIYALLAQGSELYDSSFRDILVPVLKKRIRAKYDDNLLAFLQDTDPDNMLVSSFIVSLAQKGKLTTFFPENEPEQEQILDLVARSAFKDEDSIIIFSATFMHLLEVLKPPARSYLIGRMVEEADRGSAVFSRLISVILQYYLQEYPDLLGPEDKSRIIRMTVRLGAVDLGRYLATPFAEWKADGRLASISVFHPDDDGRRSFLSNGRILLKNGYQLALSDQYTLTPLSSDRRQKIQSLIKMAGRDYTTPLRRLYQAMRRTHFALEFRKNINGIEIRHAVYIYKNQKDQEKLLTRFLRSGDEMFAQRGHSYWRSEQITDPLTELLRERIITSGDLTAKQRFLSLGSCGGVKAYTKLTRMFLGHVDLLATIGTGMAVINDPYNKNFFEVIARNPSEITWKDVAVQSAHIFGRGLGRDYLQPGSLPAILHKLLEEEKKDGLTRASGGIAAEMVEEEASL
ncbi:hypothetical protein [Desulfolithobacter dissulfuricans]|uniref:hypothetical protein n=1 Tax=Desulfolithobacter dissulfuricans TaxID=2795293 RepID=UPI002278EE73|nr:hypothetical protein [Desulfolithobacter dissulfuricans]